MQDGGQRVTTAGPRWMKPASSQDRRGGVGGHLLVHTQLFKRRKTLTQHRHCTALSEGLLNDELCNRKKSNLCTIKSQCACINAVTQTVRRRVRRQRYLWSQEWSDRLVLTQMVFLHWLAAPFSVLMKPGHVAHDGRSSHAAQNVGLLTTFYSLRKK